MKFSDIKYLTQSTSSLNVGSTLYEPDLMFYTDGNTSVNFPFGYSDKDIVKLGVYSLDGTPITSSVIYGTGTYTEHTRSFRDVLNKNITYSYSSFQSDWPLLQSETKSLFLDVAKEFKKMAILDGNYTTTIELNRNMVGSNFSSEDKLIIDKISTLRDEISVIPKSLASVDSQINSEYTIYRNNQTQVKEVAEELVTKLASPEIYSAYYTAVSQDKTGSEYFKYYYGFTNRENETNNDVDVISFITDMYYGVKKGNLKNGGDIATNDILGVYDQFKNWLYQNYEAGALFQDFRDYYYSLFKFVADQELNRITNKKPAEYEAIISFLQKIYYNIIFYPVIYLIEYKYDVDLSGYFKHYVNFDSGLSISVINKRSQAAIAENYWDKLLLKLDSPLPLDIEVGDELWISNSFGFLPIVQNIYYFTKPYASIIRLKGPNFLVRVENQGNSTETLSMDQLVNQTGSAFDGIVSKITAPADGIVDNTNYRKFENFVNFSSANLRMEAFNIKSVQIEEQNKVVDDLTNYINGNSTQRPKPPDIAIFFTSSQDANAYNTVDQYHYSQLNKANQEITRIEVSMDGYEKFLYNNPTWYQQHAASASIYDRENRNSLINNLPQFMVEDSDANIDYIKFVGMVGHFFDNMSLTIKQITDKNNYSNSSNHGISVDIVEDMLASLGWEAEISKENLPLLLSSFNQNDFDVDSELYNQARQLSEEQRNQIIWKRILNTLPYIYKTKGTEASLSSLLSCFGIPKNIIKIKEYGGIHNIHNLQDTSEYVIDEVKYEPYFSGSAEYFKVNWTGSAQTLEFNFAFDKTNISEEGHVFRLAECPGSWLLGVYRDKGLDWGKLFFSLDDGSGSVKTIMTNKAPVFDGNTYHAMLRRHDASQEFSVYNFTPSQIDQYPIKYDVQLQRAEDSRITFFATASQYLSGSCNTQFRSGSHVYIGNYNQNTASLNVDPEAFFGNIDEIKIWESPISDSVFENHTLHQNAYDMNSPVNMISDNLFRISFERPLELHAPSNSTTLNNLSFRSDFPTFDAVNFPENNIPLKQVTECDPTNGPRFPWQFTRKDSRQTVKLPDYGAGKFGSNKINYVEQELISSLSSTERSSLQSSELVGMGSNRLGIFFSPSEIQNTEIIKFFGNYPLSELIGDPSYVYASSYARFEKSRQIFYDQGFGAIDYQLFMNVVRFYFDKAMFKYIKSVVPARANLIDGILIEPSILERPKIQLKPMVQETIQQKESHIEVNRGIAGTQVPKLEDTLVTKNEGTSILSDVNQIFFPTDEDQYGFGVYSDNGVTYYNGEYYRTDVIKVEKQYQVYNKYNLPSSSFNDREINVNLNGTVQTMSSSYYKINMAKLPELTSYITTISYEDIYYSGSVSFVPPSIGSPTSFTTSSAHSLNGTILSGSVWGSTGNGVILSPGISITADYVSAYPIIYTGTFTYSGGIYHFVGSIFGGVPATLNLAKYNTTFLSSGTGPVTDDFKYRTSGTFFGSLSSGIDYKKALSMEYYPRNAELLNGYFNNHHKYGKQQFSLKEINSYDNAKVRFKWKKHSQNKKTTVDVNTGLLNNSEPIETKTV
jgi:hypothetical protein